MLLEGEEIWEVSGTGSAEEQDLSDQPLEMQEKECLEENNPINGCME